MRLLELFSGTGSVGRAFEARGWEVTSLDSNPKARPSICCDILQWDYKAFEPGHFDMVQHRPQEAAPQPAGRGRPGAQDVRDHRLPQAQVVGHREPEHRAPQNSPLHARAAHGQGHVLQVRLPLQEAHGGVAQPALAPAARATAARPSKAPATRRPRSEGPPKAAGEQLAGPALLHPARAVRRDRRERNAWGKWGRFVSSRRLSTPSSSRLTPWSASPPTGSCAPRRLPGRRCSL